MCITIKTYVMKRSFTFMIVGLLSFYGVLAQTDITPSRYVFSNQAVGPFSLDKQTPGANPPASDADVLNHWNNGFITVGNPNMANSLTFTGTGQGDILNSFYQIFDMGGQVGKVLMMKGNGSTFQYGVPGNAGFYLGWWNKSVYTDKDRTPSIAALVAGGLGEEEAAKQATVRMRLVFHIHQNVINTTGKLFDVLGYTFTGNHKQVGGALTATQEFKSGDFADVIFNEETEVEELTYNPNKWIACEYDFAAPEMAGAPLRFTFRMGGGANNTTLMIKSITFTVNPTGAAVEKEVLTLTSDPVSTSIGATPQTSDLDCYVSNGMLYVKNIEVGNKVAVYSITGGLVKALIANQNNVNIPLNKGFYVVKAGNKTAKVAVQ